jgi:hypothetical protein
VQPTPLIIRVELFSSDRLHVGGAFSPAAAVEEVSATTNQTSQDLLQVIRSADRHRSSARLGAKKEAGGVHTPIGGFPPAMHLSPFLQEALRPAASPAVGRRCAFARCLASRCKSLHLQPVA